MRTVKMACINNFNFCKYPDNISDIKGFVEYLNKNYNSFVKLEVMSQDGCVEPYFIEDKTKTEFFNVSLIRCIKESECYICTKEEYNEKLSEVVANKCVHCTYYSKDACELDFEPHKEHINLDGECLNFERKN